MTGGDTLRVERAQHLETGQHAINPVETSPQRLGVQVAAAQYRRQTWIRARPAGKYVADFVGVYPTTRLFAPLHEKTAARHIIVGQPQATTARSEDHPSELPSLMPTSYAVFCLKKQK